MMGDPELAETMKRYWKKPPVEKIVATDFLATALNRGTLGNDLCKRIVDLACGHKAVTRNVKTCPCLSCHKMILDGEDYDAWRNLRPL
jgi:hypothetical protein